MTLPAPDRVPETWAASPVALLKGDGGLAPHLAEALTDRGWTVHRDADVPDRVDLVLNLLGADDRDQAKDALRDTLLLARDTQKALEATAAQGTRAAFVTVSRIDGALGLRAPGTEALAVLGGAPGLVKTLAIEAPTLFARALDIAPEVPAAEAVTRLLAELEDAETGLEQVGLGAGGTRTGVTLIDPPIAAGGTTTPITGSDLLVVTGGGRGVTAQCVVGLAREHRPGLILLGRTELTEEPAWAQGVAEAQLRAAAATDLKQNGGKPTPKAVERLARDVVAQREIRRTVAELRDAGSDARYLAVDVTDAAATAEALAPYRDQVTGVVHGAGVLADGLITAKSAESVERVLTTKLDGLYPALAAVPDGQLRHVVLFSSVAGFFGNRGQSDYAMANEALNRLAVLLRTQHPGSHVTSINWGAWAGGMVTPALEEMFAERGIEVIQPADGVRHFVRTFDAAREDDTVVVVGPTTPLSSPESDAPARVAVERDLAPTAASPVLADHAVGGVRVLPATAAIGGLLDVVTRLGRGPVTGVSGFSVLKGITLDDDSPARLNLTVSPLGEGGSQVLVTDDGGRPRFKGTVGSAPLAPAVPVTGLPAWTDRPGTTVYTDGTLFHGPALQGIKAVLEDGERTVLACALPDAALVAGAWATDLYRPLVADVLLQAALVRMRREQGVASLPTAVGEIEIHAPLPDGGPFLVVVDDVRTTATGLRSTVTATTPAGDVLLRFRDVDVVGSPALKF